MTLQELRANSGPYNGVWTFILEIEQSFKLRS